MEDPKIECISPNNSIKAVIDRDHVNVFDLTSNDHLIIASYYVGRYVKDMFFWPNKFLIIVIMIGKIKIISLELHRVIKVIEGVESYDYDKNDPDGVDILSVLVCEKPYYLEDLKKDLEGMTRESYNELIEFLERKRKKRISMDELCKNHGLTRYED